VSEEQDLLIGDHSINFSAGSSLLLEYISAVPTAGDGDNYVGFRK